MTNLPRDSFDQEQQDRLADLRTQVSAVLAERDALRGEVVALREALQHIHDWEQLSVFEFNEKYQNDESTIDEIAYYALTATPRASKLGALVEAALAWSQDKITGDALIAAADAVLADQERQ